MNVLVACEESQAVCIAFRNKGHNAFSCDIQPCSGGFPQYHILDDVTKYLNGYSDDFCSCGSTFKTQDGSIYLMPWKWDLIIAHPPCTYLTGAGACNIPKHPERIEKGFKAKEFFMEIMNSNCDRIAIENPPPMKRFGLPKYDQLIRPYMFGERNNKPICFWLKKLPPLIPTDIVEKDTNIIHWVHKKTGAKKSCSKWYNTNTNNHSKHRSKTFIGIAQAMAEQWGNILYEL